MGLVTSNIKIVKDFPIPGINFYDFSSLTTNYKVMNKICINLANIIKIDIDGIIAAEARGFIFGSIISYICSKPLILARKSGKLPDRKGIIQASNLIEYGASTLEINSCDIQKDKKYVIVDDLIATGGTFKNIKTMVESLGGIVDSCVAVIGLSNYKDKWKELNCPIICLEETKE